MLESEFLIWAKAHNLREVDIESLLSAAKHAGEDDLVGQTVLDLYGIAEDTDDEIVDACPFDGGFVVFGWCPNGDPVAVDVQNQIGSIHYISHEESDGSAFPSLKVADEMQEFLTKLMNAQMPTDYHEAISWDFSAGRVK